MRERTLLNERRRSSQRGGENHLNGYSAVRGKLLDFKKPRMRVFHKCLEKVGPRRIKLHDPPHKYAT
jgi:hypothetical protein